MSTLKKFGLLLSIYGFIGVSFFWSNQDVVAQSCNDLMKTTLGGNDINLDRCSILESSSKDVYFSYSVKTLTFGIKRFTAQADCSNNTWAIFPENKFNKPNNQIAQKMFDVVCNSRMSPTRRVVSVVNQDLLSIKTSPNDASIACIVINPKTVNIYRSVNSWYYTDICGRVGVVHPSQIRL